MTRRLYFKVVVDILKYEETEKLNPAQERPYILTDLVQRMLSLLREEEM